MSGRAGARVVKRAYRQIMRSVERSRIVFPQKRGIDLVLDHRREELAAQIPGKVDEIQDDILTPESAEPDKPTFWDDCRLDFDETPTDKLAEFLPHKIEGYTDPYWKDKVASFFRKDVAATGETLDRSQRKKREKESRKIAQDMAMMYEEIEKHETLLREYGWGIRRNDAEKNKRTAELCGLAMPATPGTIDYDAGSADAAGWAFGDHESDRDVDRMQDSLIHQGVLDADGNLSPDKIVS